MDAHQNWKTGDGYPGTGASLDDWEWEFLRRGPDGLKERPFFRLPAGGVEFFAGPSLIQINDDGSLLDGPDQSRSNPTHMVIQFELRHDIDAQLERARRWLMANQMHRFAIAKRRQRQEKYRNYLRAWDAKAAGATLDEIAEVLYPALSNDRAEHQARKQVNKDISTAKRLIRFGLRVAGSRK